MSSHRLRRIATVVSTALLALMLIGPGAVLAAPPGWLFENMANLPVTVSPGADAGYTFRIRNGGKSNIAQLYLTDSVVASPTYLLSSRSGCQTSPVLKCAFGALNAGDSIDITVAYATPSSGTAFPVTFQLNTTGATFSDKGGNSHGDTLDLARSTALDGSKNFAGGFVRTTSAISTDASLSKKNPQSSNVTPPVIDIPVTIEDGITTFPGSGTTPCGTIAAPHCIGDWAKLNVNDAKTGPVKVILLLYGPSVPNGATVDNITLWHEGSTPNPITTRCGGTTLPIAGGQECITVTKVGNNFQILAWLAHNGSIRGAY